MESCLLCLEINKDILEGIKANSTRWQELDVMKTIEKHFWPLNTVGLNSWICLSCWRELDGFHKFYLSIEDAHTNFGKIKLDTKMTLCFPEPEIAIDHQAQPYDITEPKIVISSKSITPGMTDSKETVKSEALDKLDLDDMPLTKVSKLLRLRRTQIRDPLEKSKKKRNCKIRRKKLTSENRAEDNKIKEEPTDFDLENVDRCNGSSDIQSKKDDLKNDRCNDSSNVHYQKDKNYSENIESEESKTYKKQSKKSKENDKFIIENFKQLNFKFMCELCQASFENFIAVLKHFTKEHKQRGYVICCKRKFFTRTSLVDHLHCHLNPDHFKCNECGKALSDRITFDNHMLRVHRPSEVVRQHCCEVCDKSFIKASLLKIHELTHLPEEEKKFPCSDCGKNYGSPYHLNIHRQAVHLKRFVKICNICGKAINSSAEFKIHMNKHEGIPLPIFNCNICGLGLTSERGLKLHKDSQHPVGGKQEHHCPICPKISPTHTALRKHIHTMHEKGYDHKCSMCEKTFRRAEALKEHMASHTGTPLYTCPWCPMTFNSNGNMHSHRKNKHPKEYLELKLQKYNFSQISKNS